MVTGALSIKYRIDGVLTSIGVVQGADLAEQVISRIKVMSDLDIAERRVPQDGRFKVSIKGREIDFRVSIMPSIFGEDAVLRILDRQALADHVEGLTLDHLGFEAVTMASLRRLSAEPYGMLLVTGPTGSGKTTTLYAAISEVNTGHDKIITIEDPIEYQLPGVLQIPVNEKKGLTFVRGLRSILRHDPDKIMVGEIRDPETAQIAIQARIDRPLGIHHGTRQQRIRRHRPVLAHGGGPLQFCLGPEWNCRAKAGPAAVRALRDGRAAGRATDCGVRNRPRAGENVPVPRWERLRPVPGQRLPGTKRHRRDADVE